MVTFLGYLFLLLLVGGLLFLVGSFAFGRGEEMAPALPDRTPVELPDGRPVTADDVRALRLSVVLRGYRMDEVDWVLDQLAEQFALRDAEIARLRAALAPDGPVTGDERAQPSGEPAAPASTVDQYRPAFPGLPPRSPLADRQRPDEASADPADDADPARRNGGAHRAGPAAPSDLEQTARDGFAPVRDEGRGG